MKMEMKGSGNFISIVRFVVGFAGAIQGFVMNEFALSLAGFLLVYMGIACSRYFNLHRTRLQLKEVKLNLKQIEHEKVDARL